MAKIHAELDLCALPPPPDGKLCESGTLRRQSIGILKSAPSSRAPGKTEGSLAKTKPAPGPGLTRVWAQEIRSYSSNVPFTTISPSRIIC